MKLSLFFFLMLFQAPVLSSNYTTKYQINNICYEEVYKEKYIKGNSYKSGKLINWYETKKISCNEMKVVKDSTLIKNINYKKYISNKFHNFKVWLNSKIANFEFNKLNKIEDEKNFN